MRFEVICTLLLAILFGQPAYAKKVKRKGFNFGTSLRMMEFEKPTTVLNHDQENSRSTADIQSIKPFVGYSFANVISLGMTTVFEEEYRENTIKGTSANQNIERNELTNLSGGSLFVKLLFGRVMYLEAGGGYFQRNTNVETKYIEEHADSTFNGRQEKLKIVTAGPGYYFGGGVALPIASGFFFTTNYRIQLYKLKPYKTEENLVKSGDEKSRDISFGLAHYFN